MDIEHQPCFFYGCAVIISSVLLALFSVNVNLRTAFVHFVVVVAYFNFISRLILASNSINRLYLRSREHDAFLLSLFYLVLFHAR